MQQRAPDSPPSRGTINMISGGSTEGDSNRARNSGKRRLENMQVLTAEVLE
ncbi:hypothetical protein F511_15342 [Dorcoceras hygrometricum]|uniref:Uncharacterized protein n=1 Tax=Dorcoceras hygrometricum TaxID=472368 RepID=A0A2Z7CI89_9LAMI|nr:hypothetical protein F511_15342 [Dorcoceras hygrometricum]